MISGTRKKRFAKARLVKSFPTDFLSCLFKIHGTVHFRWQSYPMSFLLPFFHFCLGFNVILVGAKQIETCLTYFFLCFKFNLSLTSRCYASANGNTSPLLGFVLFFL